MTRGAVRRLVVIADAALVALFAIVAWNSTVWLGRTFPGFMVMENRVVPSIALPDWTDGPPSRFFQHEVVQIDGRPVTATREVYDRVAAAPPGTTFTYAFQPGGDAPAFAATVASRTFGLRDFVFLFGAFGVLGLAFGVTGSWVAFVAPQTPASLGLLSSGLIAAVFAFTAVDLYGPGWFMRLHVAAEACLAAAFLHLAAVFPTDRFGARRRPVLIAIYGAFAGLALVYEVVLDWPAAYSALHLLASSAHGVAALLLIGAVIYDYVTSDSPLVQRRIGVVALATAAGFLGPAVTMGASGLLGGKVAVNLGVLTAGLFPIGVGYAIVQQDLFEIDVLLRRATSYVIVIALVAGGYLLLLTGAMALVPGGGSSAVATPLSPVLNLAFIFLLGPLQRRVQAAVDRLFFRDGYDSEAALAELSHGLASAHTIDDVLSRTEHTLAATVSPLRWWLFTADDGVFRRIAGSDGPAVLELPAALASRAADGRILTRYEWDDGARAAPDVWRRLDAEVLIPIRSAGPPLAFLALGAKASGHPYGINDDTFLRASANQLALAITSAGAFAELAGLNSRLEEQVRERTRALQSANYELNGSLDELRGAYDRLERNQASLMRADRLATLGRLAAGMAHEVNTPLGAVHNSLRVTTDLAREYVESIEDPSVTPDDHRAIARELLDAAEAAAGWARKASSFIAKVKLHSREAPSNRRVNFNVGDVVAETEALLAHRLRSAVCRIDYAHDGDPTLQGDPARLGQVLMNLVGNAIDAYEDRGIADGAVTVRATRTADAVVCTVADRAGGIPEDVLPRIFDELFTTKEPGRGTGLGLWIARQLIEETFGGALTVTSEAGVGTCFTLALPLAHAAADADRSAA